MRLDLVTFNVELVNSLPETERKIVLEELHFNRGDYNDNIIRSTQSRVKYKGHEFKLFNVPNYISPGDIIIESDKNYDYNYALVYPGWYFRKVFIIIKYLRFSL